MKDADFQFVESLDKERLVQDSLDLVNVDSPTGKEAEVAELYASKLKALGMKVTMQEVEPERYNVLATLQGDSSEKATLMFNGHLDTSFSAADDPEILKAISPVYRTAAPWGYVKEDWLYGMGSFNMKAALAAYAAAVRTIQDSGERISGTIMIAGVVGEIEKTQVDKYTGPAFRGYGYGTAYLVAHGGTADVAVLGEPTGLRLMCAHSGSCWFKIGLKGKLVHTGHSTSVVNVIQQMNRVITALEEWVPDYQNRYSYHGAKPTVNVGSIEGGWPWRASRTPSFCNLYVDVRFPPPFHALDIRAEVSRVLEHLKEKEGISPELEIYVVDEWSEVSTDEYISKSISRAHTAVLKKPIDVVYFSWSSDANILTRHGVVAVNYGPSGGPGMETRGAVYIPNLLSCAKIYSIVTKDVCNKTRAELKRTK